MEAYTKLAIVAILLAASFMSSPTQVVGDSTICGMTLDNIMTCRPAATENPLPPSPACCAALSNADMQCLCKYRKSSMLRSFGVDPIQAVQLPVRCNLLQAVPCV